MSSPLLEWSDLPEEMLELVLKNLLGFSDYIQFRSVCREWRELAKPGYFRPQLPLLMLPYHPLADVRSFFCPVTRKSFDVHMPELVGKVVLTSSFGWMVVLDLTTKALSLLNPITRAQVQLPPTDGFHQLLDLRLASDGNGLRVGTNDDVRLSAMEFGTICRWEVSLSSKPSPADADSYVVVSDTCKVYFCLPGDGAWSYLTHHAPRSAVYHAGRFYVMGTDAELTVFDAGDLSKLRIIPSPIRSEAIYRYFISLAKDSSELVMFSGNPNIIYERDPYEVFKMDLSKEEEGSEWLRISNLQETGFYWSMKQCLFVNGGDFPAATKGRIYFNGVPYKNEVDEPSHQISIVKMKDGDCKLLNCGGEKPSEKLMKPAWITINLC